MLLILGESEWRDYFKQHAKLFDNSCHSLSRHYCYEHIDELNRIEKIKFNLKWAHLFHNAVPCAKSVLAYPEQTDGLAFLE